MSVEIHVAVPLLSCRQEWELEQRVRSHDTDYIGTQQTYTSTVSLLKSCSGV